MVQMWLCSDRAHSIPPRHESYWILSSLRQANMPAIHEERRWGVTVIANSLLRWPIQAKKAGTSSGLAVPADLCGLDFIVRTMVSRIHAQGAAHCQE